MKEKEDIVGRAYDLFEEFRSAYEAEWQRQDANEKLYRGDHWEMIASNDPTEPQPVTPVLQSTIENVQADLMDRSPIAVIRPENPIDDEVAVVVNALIRQNHDAQNFRKEYRNMCHDFLVQGYCVQEAGYDVHAYHNIGQAFIRYVDCRAIMFDPQVENIQDGRAIFKIAPTTIHKLEQMYPEYAGKFERDHYSLTTRQDEMIKFDQDKSVLMLEYWWREYSDGMWHVHMAKIAGHQLLEDSRKEKPEGYVASGEYPFVVSTCFRRKGTPLGYGLCDVFGAAQVYSDKLDQIVMKNALMASKNKMLVNESSGFDVEDLQDWRKEVHRGENLNGVTWFPNPPLPAYIVSLSAAMRENVKDESGANDFSRGGTTSGVTAASAIAALQEMSNKRSRMCSEQLHEAFREAVRMEIEFEREYNVVPREVLVTTNGEQHPATFDSAIMERQQGGMEMPIEFFVSVKIETEQQFQTATHNELILQLVQLGAIQPQQAVEFMLFEGKEEILQAMKSNQPQMDPAMQEAMAEQEALEAKLPEQTEQQQATQEQMPQLASNEQSANDIWQRIKANVSGNK